MFKNLFRRNEKKPHKAIRNVKSRKGCSFTLDALESRELLTVAPWGLQGRQIGQDLAAINFPTITGAGQTIAVIDAGVNVTHPDLGGGIGSAFKIIDGFDFINNTSDPSPKTGDPHGTGTTGMAAANAYVLNGYRYQGVAPKANIVALRAADATLANALDWVIAHRVQDNIVAVELIGTRGAAIASQVQALVNAGVFLGTPSGNGGAGKLAKRIPGIVNTGSVSPSNQISDFTQRGPNLDLVAPGESVAVTWEVNGQHAEVIGQGTSWSSPQVVGAAALIKQINPKFNESQILAIMQDTGTPVYDAVSGRTYAELNVNAALALATAQSRPVTPAATKARHRASPARHPGGKAKPVATPVATKKPVVGHSVPPPVVTPPPASGSTGHGNSTGAGAHKPNDVFA